MECKEGKPREDVDTGVQAAPPLWQRIVPRAAFLALVGIAAEAFLSELGHSRAEFRHKLTETQPTTGYAIETTATKAAPAVNRLVPEVSPAATAPITVDRIASPPRSVADQPAALQLTTNPAGATFAVYPGIIADKAAPVSAPLRTGTAPGTVEDLREGNYTIFFTRRAGRTAGPKSSWKRARFVRSSTRFSMAKLRSTVFQTARKFFAALFRLGSRR